MNTKGKGIIHFLYIGQDADGSYFRKTFGAKFRAHSASGQEEALTILSSHKVYVVICGNGTLDVLPMLAQEHPLIPCIVIIERLDARQIFFTYS